MACGLLGPQPGIKPAFPSFQGGFLITDHQGSPRHKDLLLLHTVAGRSRAHKDAVWPPLLFDAELTPRSGAASAYPGDALCSLCLLIPGACRSPASSRDPLAHSPCVHLLLVWGWEYWQCISLTMTSLLPRCCCCSIAKSCPTLCNPMNCSTQGFSVLHYLLEFAQAHVHDESVTPSKPLHSLSSPSPPAFSLSKHQGFLQWISSLHYMVRELELHLQHQSFQWIFRVDFL